MPGVEMAFDPIRLRKVISSLRLVFWGGILLILDFTVSNNDLRFDIFNDFIGMLLMTAGVFRLASTPLGRGYARGMGFVELVCVVSTILALVSHVVLERETFVALLETAYALVELAAILVFCVSMRLMSTVAGLERSARSWRMTGMLYLWIYVIPLGLFHLAVGGAILTGGSFHINLGPAGLLLLPVLFIPPVHFFVSTSRMSREARVVADAAKAGVCR